MRFRKRGGLRLPPLIPPPSATDKLRFGNFEADKLSDDDAVCYPVICSFAAYPHAMNAPTLSLFALSTWGWAASHANTSSENDYQLNEPADVLSERVEDVPLGCLLNFLEMVLPRNEAPKPVTTLLCDDEAPVFTFGEHPVPVAITVFSRYKVQTGTSAAQQLTDARASVLPMPPLTAA